ncbi:MAG: dienelactone hydrolase family protein [Desulfamplus sp.]|nr:dienelactone hydrolase family protein [Desulfamplus sp.]
MKLIIVSDIFGVTRHLITLAESLSPEYEIVDPYNGQVIAFESESEAYNYFSTVCGLQRYTDSLKKRIDSSNEKILIVGFSIGASAVWNTLSSDCACMIEEAVCFYGSRIRDKSNLKPCCATTLIFPCKETSFSVSDLSLTLSKTYNVNCINTEYFHGFMNKCSDNFDSVGYFIYINWLKNKVHYKVFPE